MKSGLVIALLIAVVIAQTDTEWNDYKALFGKKYTPDEDIVRRKYWEDNYRFVATQNAISTHASAQNKFSDLSPDELNSKRANLCRSAGSQG